ncbi:restriction endonuclease subunit S [Clostridium omnivorum]|uniref:Type I restriction modification DNA specificity domain-containing protein n=1 Tax=Clostridium omnivorum TaxID=1604902 RepID=A0ABQ5N7I9_9CLOT|nr:restriction endonuclease subunit S [Clostridium sp. E14]GLC31166.1 hypothetical protein bsdE14_25760 [Clostridium sp. E14]
MVENVLEGYKKTEVGVIPEEWKVRKLKQITNMKSGVSITAKDIDESGEYPCYGGNGLRGYTSRFTHNGRYALIGRQGALCGNVQYVEGTFFASEHAVVVTPNPEIDIEWLSYMLIDMNLNQYSESSAQPGLSVTKILELSIPVPSKRAEQTAISTALSDIDELINSLTKLIDKKKNIRQGVMQELLRGRKRLNGFSGEWETKIVEEIAVVSRGRVISHKEISNSLLKKYPVYSSQTTSNGIMGYIDSYDFDGEYITWTTDGVNAGTVFYRKGKFNCTNVCGTIKLLHGNHYFVAKRLELETGKFVSKNLANPKLMNDVMKKITITIPPTIKEQTAIAQILTDMDNEINKLTQKLDKYKTLKQAMMQELLTGKRRLI